MNKEALALLARKVAIAFGVGAGAALAIKAPAAIDALEAQDWPELEDLVWTLGVGVISGGLRAVVSLLTAIVPTDALHGANLVGKWRDAPVVTSSTPPTKIDVEP